MKKDKKMNNNDIKLNGIKALNKALGPTCAFKFISLVRRDNFDYISWVHEFYKDQTLEDIYKQAKKNWEKKYGSRRTA